MTPNHLDWPDCLNVRDLGGLATRQGRRIRSGALIRSDCLDKLSLEGIEAFRACGVSRIIDLRLTSERENAPGPFVGEASYLHLPVQTEEDRHRLRLPLSSLYCTLLDLRPDRFAAAVAAIAEAPDGAVVVHCSAGQDRTGLVIALALAMVEVTPAEIAADYALTEQRLRQHNAAWLEGAEDLELRELVLALQTTPPRNMLTALAHLERAYGGVQAYLEKGGLTAGHAAALRYRLWA